MRYTINKINKGEDELILNYKEKNPEVEAVLLFMDKRQRKLIGRKNDETIVFAPEEILYIEKVDNKTFVYTDDNEIQVEMSLYSIELFLDDESYFRCSKSMIINVNKVEMLKSMPSNRIDATLVSGEHIIISRTYASDFRKLLKGEMA
ncbi:MAG: LytTR family DNA-binding domain-containing protein [Dorea longicatena]